MDPLPPARELTASAGMEGPMKEIFHIRRTVHRIGRQLEQLATNHIGLTRAFELLAKKAQSVEEMVVIEVMREVYQEYENQRFIQSLYADSNTRSARMPEIAFNR
jgi:hypothetical protein